MKLWTTTTTAVVLSLLLVMNLISGTAIEHYKSNFLKSTAAESEGGVCLVEDDVLEWALAVTNCIGAVPIGIPTIPGLINQGANCVISFCLSKSAINLLENVVGCMIGFAPGVGNYFAAMGCQVPNLPSNGVNRRYMVSGSRCYQGVGGSNSECREAVADKVRGSNWKSDVDEGVCPFNFTQIKDSEIDGKVTVTTFKELPKQRKMQESVGYHVCIKNPYRDDKGKDSYVAVHDKELTYHEHCGKYALWEILPIEEDGEEWVQIRNIKSDRYLKFASDTSDDPSTTSSSSSSRTHLWVEDKGSGKFCIYGKVSSGRRYIVHADELFGNDFETTYYCDDDDQRFEITKVDTLCSDLPHMDGKELVEWYSGLGEEYTCSWYGENMTRCFYAEGGEKNFGYTPQEACCACGGGQRFGA